MRTDLSKATEADPRTSPKYRFNLSLQSTETTPNISELTLRGLGGSFEGILALGTRRLMKEHVQVLKMLKLNKSDPDFSLMRPLDKKTSGVSSHRYHGQSIPQGCGFSEGQHCTS